MDSNIQSPNQKLTLLDILIKKTEFSSKISEFADYGKIIAAILESKISDDLSEYDKEILNGIKKLFLNLELTEKERSSVSKAYNKLYSKLMTKDLTSIKQMLIRKVNAVNLDNICLQNPLKMRGPSCKGPFNTKDPK